MAGDHQRRLQGPLLQLSMGYLLLTESCLSFAPHSLIVRHH